MIRVLNDAWIRKVYILEDYPHEKTPELMIQEAVRSISNQRLAETFENVRNNLAFEMFAPEEIKKRLEEHDSQSKQLQIPSPHEEVGELLQRIIDRQLAVFASLPAIADNAAELEHVVNTTVLSLLISLEFKYDLREMETLGTAAVLHDIGRLAIPHLAERPYIELSPDEKMLFEEHPIYSMLILKAGDPRSYIEQRTVMQHHEQDDGNGYPQGLKGFGKPPVKDRGKDTGFIHRHAEILGVANVYDGLLSGRWDGTRHTPEEAVTAIVNRKVGSYNPHIIRALASVTQCFPTGSTVVIKDNHSKSYIGYTAIVMETSPETPSRPKLLLTHDSIGAEIPREIVDFRDERYMNIELVL